jgi:hypothetical protein
MDLCKIHIYFGQNKIIHVYKHGQMISQIYEHILWALVSGQHELISGTLQLTYTSQLKINHLHLLLYSFGNHGQDVKINVQENYDKKYQL